MLFVSHANPEDNEFALWLSLRLAREGYPVWCDLTRLLGGENFWTNIEDAIRHRASKFLFVLSRTSNVKRGPLDELQVARNVARDQSLQDFVIPLAVDDLPPRDGNISVASITAISFVPSWARGLMTLLQKLERDSVEKRDTFSPSSVAEWWRATRSGSDLVRSDAEVLLSNWYPLRAPLRIFLHDLKRAEIGKVEVPSGLPFPSVQHEQYLATLAPSENVEGHLGPALSIRDTLNYTFGDWPSAQPRPWDVRQERNVVTSLLRQAWRRMINERALPVYPLANKAECFYFKKDAVEDNWLTFKVPPKQEPHRRQVVGFKTIKHLDGTPPGIRYWHFALEGKPLVSPIVGFTLRPHVLFSDDGAHIWESKERLHRARRSQCKSWWNEDWRDRILASAAFLAGDAESIRLPVGGSTWIPLSPEPVQLSSPVSYVEPSSAEPVDEAFGEDGDEDDDGDVEVVDGTPDDEHGKNK